MAERLRPTETEEKLFVANCNECEWHANGDNMGDMYRAAEQHSLETDHVECYVYPFSKPTTQTT